MPIPFGKARQLATGTDLTIVTWSTISAKVQAAAATLATDGIHTDVLDLRTLWPWDQDAVAASLEKTGRLLVVHEAVEVAGFGAEIVATMVDRLGPQRIKAAKRLGAPRLPIPFAPPLENAIRVTPEKIATAARALVAAESS